MSKYPKLNLPDCELRIRSSDSGYFVFDPLRKRYIKLTDEEWVRQNFIKFLINEKKCPGSLIAVEMHLMVNNISKRCDVVIFDRKAKPVVIVECKAPSVKIDQKVFDQITAYNFKLRVDYLIVTNGLQHFICQMDYNNQSYRFLKEIPFYSEMTGI